jgi:hypothetical protein
MESAVRRQDGRQAGGRLANGAGRLLIESMRTLLMGFVVVCSMAVVDAQDFVAPAGVEREIAVETPEPILTIDGIVTQIFTSKPWQAVNPAAPAEYGNGEKNVTKDIAGGTPYQATTLTLVGVEW